jgi:hypothetical protein
VHDTPISSLRVAPAGAGTGTADQADPLKDSAIAATAPSVVTYLPTPTHTPAPEPTHDTPASCPFCPAPFGLVTTDQPAADAVAVAITSPQSPATNDDMPTQRITAP